MVENTQTPTYDSSKDTAFFAASAAFLVLLFALITGIFLLPHFDSDFDFREKATETTINAAAFPDARFRAYIADNFDTDSNGLLSIQERLAVTAIGSYDKATYRIQETGLSNRQISSLIGIALFPNLESIEAGNNEIVNVDITGNAKLRYLDMRNNDEFGLTYTDANQGTQVLVSNDYQLQGDVSGINTIIA